MNWTSTMWNILTMDDTLVKLWDAIETEGLNSTSQQDLEHLLFEERTSEKQTRDWLLWANKRQNVKCINADIPAGVLPSGFSGTLTDVKVQGKRWGPDDVIYNRNKDIRDKVARGNCVLTLHHKHQISHHFLIFALKKFTGGLGDEDDYHNVKNNLVWQDYFIKPISQAAQVVCMKKLNGEAGHLSVCSIGGKLFVCAGSKNVHMLLSSRGDIKLYKDSRYEVARIVAGAAMDILEGLDESKCELLLNFLYHTGLTATFELLQPSHQHVEDLSNLPGPEVRFIAWTRPYREDDDSYTAVPPHVGVEIGNALGLKTVSYEVIRPQEVEQRFLKILHRYGEEGEVLYFLDSRQCTIGLTKKKCGWYVLCRAIREKVCSAAMDHDKNGMSSLSNKERSMSKRLQEIQKWLGLSDQAVDAWKVLALEFLRWAMKSNNRQKIPNGNIRPNFPVYWKMFLGETNRTDKIELG